MERRRGAGTFVAPPKIHFNKLMSYTEQMASRGLAAGSRLLCNRVIDDAPDIAARLALPLNSRMVKVRAAPSCRQRALCPRDLLSCGRGFCRPHARPPGAWFPVLHAGARLRFGSGPRG